MSERILVGQVYEGKAPSTRDAKLEIVGMEPGARTGIPMVQFRVTRWGEFHVYSLARDLFTAEVLPRYQLETPEMPAVADSFRRYEELARSTSQWAGEEDRDQAAICAALGLVGEAGELANLVKKQFYHRERIDPEAVMREAGDVLWYLSDFLASYGYEHLDQVAQRNIDKLAARWPNGFRHGDRQRS